MNNLAFFPARFRQSRPYAAALAENLRSLKLIGALNPKSSFEAAGRLCARALFADKDKAKAQEQQEDVAAFAKEMMQALAWGQWLLDGAQIYAFAPELAEALLHSDTGSVCIHDLNFPFQSAYFHFGTQCGLPFADTGLLAEGAYALWSTQSLRIVLCAGSAGPDPRPWSARAFDALDLRIPSELYGLPLREACRQALGADLADLDRAEARLGDPGASLAAGSMRQSLSENYESWAKACELICNGLCFLSGYPEDALRRWQEGAPAALLSQCSHPLSPKARSKAASKLRALGFSQITELGGAFAQALRSREAGAAGAHRSPRAHWRKGHWRMQAFGRALQERKLVWIAPAMVAGNPEPEDAVRVRTVSVPKTS